MGFAPFARVVEGMETVFAAGGDLYEPNPVPEQGKLKDKGNAWVLEDYPCIDLIKSTEITMTLGVGGDGNRGENEEDVGTPDEVGTAHADVSCISGSAAGFSRGATAAVLTFCAILAAVM
jgi:hypothetical protein